MTLTPGGGGGGGNMLTLIFPKIVWTSPLAGNVLCQKCVLYCNILYLFKPRNRVSALCYMPMQNPQVYSVCSRPPGPPPPIMSATPSAPLLCEKFEQLTVGENTDVHTGELKFPILSALHGQLFDLNMDT